MSFKSLKLFLVAAFSVFLVLFSRSANAQEPLDTTKTAHEGKFDPAKIILEHVLDAHEFHFFSYQGSDGEEHEISIPLPVILYSPQRGLSAFSYARFHDHDSHGMYNGYKNEEGKIVAVDANGNVDEGVKVYDLSLTRNVVQMFIALILLVWILLSAASKYRKHGTNVAPTGHFRNSTFDRCQQVALNDHRVARQYHLAPAKVLNPKEVSPVVFRIGNGIQYQDSTDLCHSFDLQHARHDRIARKVALEKIFVSRDILYARHAFIIEINDLVDQ